MARAVVVLVVDVHVAVGEEIAGVFGLDVVEEFHAKLFVADAEDFGVRVGFAVGVAGGMVEGIVPVVAGLLDFALDVDAVLFEDAVFDMLAELASHREGRGPRDAVRGHLRVAHVEAVFALAHADPADYELVIDDHGSGGDGAFGHVVDRKDCNGCDGEAVKCRIFHKYLLLVMFPLCDGGR